MSEYVILNKGMIFMGWQGQKAYWCNKLTDRSNIAGLKPQIYDEGSARLTMRVLVSRGYTEVRIHPIQILEDPIDG